MKAGRASFTRQTAEARRRLLIDALLICLQRQGTAGLSVRNIALQAQVSPGLVAHHFGGIEGLIAEGYRDVAARVGATLDAAADLAGADPRQRLTAYLTASFRPPVRDDSLFAAWIAFWDLGRSSKLVAATHRQLYAEYRGRVEALLADCFVPAAARRLAAIAATALVDGLWLELCLDHSAVTAEEACRIAEDWVAQLPRPDEETS